jgi:hypothetical protein
MQIQETFSHLNWLAIFCAALSTFVLGGIWYSLLEKKWMAANNFTKEYLSKRNLPLVFGLSFVFAFIMAFNLAMFLGVRADMTFGIIAGFLSGFGWVFFSIGIIALFERRSVQYVLINGGYMILAFTVMGAIIGVWH